MSDTEVYYYVAQTKFMQVDLLKNGSFSDGTFNNWDYHSKLDIVSPGYDDDYCVARQWDSYYHYYRSFLIYQYVSYPPGSVSQVKVRTIRMNACYFRVFYEDGSGDQVTVGLTSYWSTNSIAPNPNKRITRIELYGYTNSDYQGKADLFEVVLEPTVMKRVRWATSDYHLFYADSGGKSVSYNVSDYHLYREP